MTAARTPRSAAAKSASRTRMADTEHRDIGRFRQFCDIRIALPAQYRSIIGVDRKYRTGKADAIKGGDQSSPYRGLLRRTDDRNRSWPKECFEPHRSSLLEQIRRPEITMPRL